LIYSALFLWLSWRKFVRLEIRAAGLNQPVSGSFVLNRKLPLVRLFVPRPGEKVRNLIRKELRLEKPVLMLAGVFIVCWLATALLQWLRPAQNITYVFDALIWVYAPLTAVLAGCVPLGEEKVLGLFSSQLTQPCSHLLQWSLKLAVGTGTVVVLCLGIPIFLWWSTVNLGLANTSETANNHKEEIVALAAFCGLAFLLTYWAISHVANMIRAALAAVCGLVAAGACIVLGGTLGQESHGLETGAMVALVCRLQLSPEVVQTQITSLIRYVVFSGIGCIFLLLLRQSFVQFHKSDQSIRALIANSIFVLGLVTGLSFWSFDIQSSAIELNNARPVQELRRALNYFAWTQPRANQPQQVSLDELQTRISKQTRRWLRDATVSYQLIASSERANGEIAYIGNVKFPNGSQFSFNGGYLRGRGLR
jgi:hypothetical protein